MNSKRQQVTIQYPEGDSINARRVIRNVTRDERGNETGEAFVKGHTYKVERGAWNNYNGWVGHIDS